MLRSFSVQVEVNVQNCFFEFEGLTASVSSKQLQGVAVPTEGDSGISPIPNEVWEFWFQSWLNYLHPELSPIQSYEVSLRLTGDREIQALNAHYRSQDQPTDVLAFASLEIDYPQIEEMHQSLPLYLGDIVISIETAQRQAQQQDHSLKQELAWLSAHGLLHLLGWDHPDETSLMQMLSQQEVLLQTVGWKTDDDVAADEAAKT